MKISICLLLLLVVSSIHGQGDDTTIDNNLLQLSNKEQLELTDEVNCLLPPDVGLCKALIPRYFFNSTSQSCEEFIYGGCLGNSNNFQSFEDCQVKCSKNDTLVVKALDNTPSGEIDCEIDPDIGFCKALIPRFFHNKTTGKCEEFYYGGCGGNTNNFQLLEECQKNCVKNDAPIIEKISIDVPPQLNCDDDPEIGFCKALIPRFFYNKTTDQCEEFIYGGCGGNTNNFQSFEDCQKSCVKSVRIEKLTVDDTLSQPNCIDDPDVGLCKALIPRYFHNATTKQCEEFFYGGCGGNTNNYESLETCQKICNVSNNDGEPIISGGKPVDTSSAEPNCKIDPDVGPCLALLPRYFYNATSRKCEQFFFGGCGGNSNNFKTMEECETKCGANERSIFETSTPIDVDCMLVPEVGNCRALLPRFFYNATSQTCEKFYYGGCGGNSNRFMTLDDCKAVCGGQVMTTTPFLVITAVQKQKITAEEEPAPAESPTRTRQHSSPANSAFSVIGNVGTGAFLLVSLAASSLLMC